MFGDGTTWRWLGRAQWLAYGLFGLVALTGYAYGAYGLVNGSVFDGVIAVVVGVGAMAMGIGLRCMVHISAMMDAQARKIHESAQRVDALESVVEQLGPMLNLSRVGTGDVSRVVAATTGKHRFPRLVRGPAGGKERTKPSSGQSVDPFATGSPERESKPSGGGASLASPARLRQEFRDAVYTENFARALRVGREIEARYPESAMAKQFARLRSRLESQVAKAG